METPYQAAVRNLIHSSGAESICFHPYRKTDPDWEAPIWAPSQSLTDKTFQELADRLDPDMELAIRSTCRGWGQTFHIPLMDFKGPIGGEVLNRLVEYAEKNQYRYLIGDSGRSYHAWFGTLLSTSEHLKFYGWLLANPMGDFPIDVRHIGHALRKGFGSLRVSNRTPYHPDPIRIVLASPSLMSKVQIQTDLKME